MKISAEVLQVLEASRVENGAEGCLLFLPDRQLERKLYEAVNKILEAMGGQWLRKSKAHLFAGKSNVADLLDAAMISREVTDAKKEFQFFPTPAKIAAQMVEWAEIKPDMSILEPSAGDGAIARFLPGIRQCIFCVELNEEMVPKLQHLGFNAAHGDFLKSNFPKPFDRILMNPPFTRQQDVDHILHAYNQLALGGVMVALSSPSWQFRENAKSVAFRQWLQAVDSDIREIPEGAFKTSGTMIRTVMIKVNKG